MKITLRLVTAILAVLMIITPVVSWGSGGDPVQEAAALIKVDTSIPCKSAILIEQSTGKVMFQKDPDVRMSPASITKVMTLLLVMEALDSGKITMDEKVTTSTHANSMGGSQIWLAVGEQMTVEELLRATAISSANDAAVALAEHVSGTEADFVEAMNTRAKELGMENTTFINATGLDAEGHLTTARDIAVMSAELLKHDKIIPFVTTWMSELRGGATSLVNTNKLVRFYKGTTGLKTGTTDDAGHCLTASASKNGLDLIAVVLGAQTSDQRFGAARGLLDYGYANYKAEPVPELEEPLKPMKVTKGVEKQAVLEPKPPEKLILEKGKAGKLVSKVELPESIPAPVSKGEQVGEVTVFEDGVLVAKYPIVVGKDIAQMNWRAAIDQVIRRAVRMGKGV